MHRYHTYAILGYLALTIALFMPVLPQLTSAIPGGPVADVDGWQNVWHLWWTLRALRDGQSPLFTPLLFHPMGVDLALHPLNLSNGILALPVTAWLGPVAAYNLVSMASFVIGGWAAYALALRVGSRPAAAFASGLVFAFGPFHLAKLWDGQLELIATQWVVCFALAALVATSERGWRAALAAGVALAVVGYTSLYYLLFCAILLCVMALLWLPWNRPLREVATYLSRCALVPLLALILLTPILVRLLRDSTSLSLTAGDDRVSGDFLFVRSANLVDFFLPSPLHPLWGDTAARIGQALHPGIAAWNIALGYTAIALAIIGLVLVRPQTWRWGVVALVGALLALGPVLSVGPMQTMLPMPYQLLVHLPGMGLARRPSHFVILTIIALVPLVGLGLTTLGERFGRPRLVAVAATVLLLVEYVPQPFPALPFQVDPVYYVLAGRPGALLVTPNVSKGTFSLTRQIIHERPIVGGFLARQPPYPFVEYTPGVRQLWRLRPEKSGVTEPLEMLGPLALRSAGITDVVIDLAYLPPERMAEVATVLAHVLPNTEPIFADEHSVLYPVPEVPLRPFAYLGAGWHDEEGNGDYQWRWMGAEAEVFMTNPLPEPRVVTLLLRGESYLHRRPVALSLNGTPVGTWDLGARQEALALRLLLTPGDHYLTLRAPTDPEGGRSRRDLSLLLTEVTLVP